MLTNPRRYLDPLNFATNFCFFRDPDGLSTRLVTANYWAGYGAAAGAAVAAPVRRATARRWPPGRRRCRTGPGGFAIDSAEVRARFGLPEFTGQLFIHAIGVAGHDVVKYALDTFGTGNDASLSCTHDANAWPAERYAGLPAPAPGERVVLWVQNSHAAPIPAGAVAARPHGRRTAGGACRARCPASPRWRWTSPTCCPDVAWPAQIEMRAGRHVVRPRYEVVRGGRTRIAHVNVERADLVPDPGIPRCRRRSAAATCCRCRCCRGGAGAR